MISTHIANLIRVYWLHIVFFVSVALNAWLLTRPDPQPVTITKTEYADRVVEKEVVKVVNNDIVKYRDRVITRTITEPGGTKIVEQVQERAGEHDKSTGVVGEKVVDKTTKRTESVAIYPQAPRYLLGLSATPRGDIGSLSFGVRIASKLPVYAGAGVTKVDRSYKFSLNVGVVF